MRISRIQSLQHCRYEICLNPARSHALRICSHEIHTWPQIPSCLSTPRGFEPLRAEPNGFLVHHLSHSVTVSHADGEVGSVPSLRTWPRQDMYVAALLVYKARLCVNQSASPAEQTMRSRAGVGGAHAAALARAGLEMTEAVPMMMMGRQQCRQSRQTVRHRVVLCIITCPPSSVGRAQGL